MTRAATVAPLLALAGCLRNGGADAPDRIRFEHAIHQDVAECKDCHDLEGKLLPLEAKCLECHSEKEEGKCATCHSQPDAPRTFARADRHLLFSHPDHESYGADDCLTCHRDGAAPAIPKHAECGKCHADVIARSECAVCHRDLLRWPLQPTVEMAHRGDFLRAHAAAATVKGATCGSCHDQSFCASCHKAENVPLGPEWRAPEAVARAFVHRGDYVARHALEAASSPTLCYRCHDTATCEGCHAANQIAGRTAASPHPPGWARPGSGEWHGSAARLRIESCAACHDQGAASICVSCHRVGGAGGSPHPPGWQAYGRTFAEQPCLACHL